MKTSDFDYVLPPNSIAQEPLPERTQSRMMVVSCASGGLEHRRVGEIGRFLRPGDLLVVNNTRVIPARLLGHRADTRGKVEVLLIEAAPDPVSDGGVTALEGASPPGGHLSRWEAFYHATGKARVGLELELANGVIRAVIRGLLDGGRVLLELITKAPLLDVLEEEGLVPVPPYIERTRPLDTRDAVDRVRYQTVFAEEAGAVAAPTAGLHFSRELLAELASQGVRTVAVTLHVGPGTFRPVKADEVDAHVMDPERYFVSDEAVAAINDTHDAGGRVVAVGTTTVRALESAVLKKGFLVAGQGRSALFIRPPYAFKLVDALLTNFHLPRSTLLMMVSAFASDRIRIASRGSGQGAFSSQFDASTGRGAAAAVSAGMEIIRHAYAAAVAEGYRFYSYGDCMLIL